MSKGVFWFSVYLAFGIYLLNKGVMYYNLSNFIPDSVDRVIIIIGAVLILFGGINHFRVSSRHRRA